MEWGGGVLGDVLPSSVASRPSPGCLGVLAGCFCGARPFFFFGPHFRSQKGTWDSSWVRERRHFPVAPNASVMCGLAGLVFMEEVAGPQDKASIVSEEFGIRRWLEVVCM